MEDRTIIPELYVMGAGPGDPELITVKGHKILQQANVVLYDNLASKELLSITRDDCEKIYVGKRPYGDYTPQERILELIKEKPLKKAWWCALKAATRLFLDAATKRFYLPVSMALKPILSRELPACRPAVF